MIIILQNTVIYDFQTLFKGEKFGMYGDCWDGRGGVPLLGLEYSVCYIKMSGFLSIINLPVQSQT